MTPKSPADSLTETVHVVLPNDANPLGFILGGTVMHLIDMAGAIAALRHARVPIVTAAVDDLQFLHPITVGDLIILRARVNAAFTTSMEVEVEVFSEEPDRRAPVDQPRVPDVRDRRQDGRTPGGAAAAAGDRRRQGARRGRKGAAGGAAQEEGVGA